MRQHAGLRGNIEPQSQFIQHGQQGGAGTQVVGGRIDADHRIAHAEQQPVQRGAGDADGIVGRMVGLQPAGKPPGQADGAAERGDDLAFCGDDN